MASGGGVAEGGTGPLSVRGPSHPTRALIHLPRLTRNLALLQSHVGTRAMWPAIKANAYGHDARIVARHLVELGYRTLCVAHVAEAAALIEAGVPARFVVLSATLAHDAEHVVALDVEPVVCTRETVDALARAASRAGKRVALHLKVDTGMGRVGIAPQETAAFLEHCRRQPGLHVKGVMSHFARADESDKAFSHRQLALFDDVRRSAAGHGVEVFHMANSAAIFDLPEAYLDAVRPGISIYGLRPSASMLSPRCAELEPVLELKSSVTLLKEVPAGTGLSYGHAFRTRSPSLIATVPIGYGDGLARGLSNRLEVLVGGRRCPQVGRITMDQSLVDVTPLRGRVALGDEVVVIGRQGDAEVSADELAATLDTINYEIVTAIAARVPRIAVAAQ